MDLNKYADENLMLRDPSAIDDALNDLLDEIENTNPSLVEIEERIASLLGDLTPDNPFAALLAERLDEERHYLSQYDH